MPHFRTFPLALALVVCLLGSLQASAECVPSWGPGQLTSSIAYESSWPAVGDFDGDGKSDLALATATTISIFLNVDGKLAPPTQFAAGEGLSSLLAEDVNGDGDVDLIRADAARKAIAVFPGHGDGTFGSRIETNTGVTPSRLVAADFNADGKVDLGVLDIPGAVVAIWLGDGTGAFTDGGADTPYAGELYSLRAADFNGDAKADLLWYTYNTDKLQLFAGNGDGTVDAPVQIAGISNPSSLVTGDLDNDGDVDLLQTGPSLVSFAVMLNSGGGVFAPPVTIAETQQVFPPVLADFSGDGVLDATYTVSGGHSHTIYTRSGNGDGTFSDPTVFVPSFGSDRYIRVANVTVADTDGDDAWDDLVVTTWVGSSSARAYAALTNACRGAHVAATPHTSVLAAGQSSSVTATVQAVGSVHPARPVPTGEVTLFNGTTFLSTATLAADGTATLAVSGLPVGNHALHLHYGGDDRYDPNDSATIPLRVVSESEISTVTLESPTNPRPWGQQTSLGGTVANPTGTPTTGVVEIYRDGAAVGQANVSAGTWSITMPDWELAAGTYQYRVRYRGGAYAPSALSAPLAVEVTRVASSVNGWTPDIVRVGEQVRIELRSQPATGTVSLYDGAKLLQTQTPNEARAYVFTFTLAEGRHAMTARYHQTASHASSELAFAVVSLPPGEVAINVSAINGAVSVAWVGSLLQRWVPNFGWSMVSRDTGVTYLPQNPVPGTLYAFRAVRSDQAGNPIAYATDAAVFVTFTDEGLAKGTAMKAVHVTELVTAINTWRSAFALTPIAIANAVKGKVIRAADVNALNNGLNGARAATGMPAIAFAVVPKGARIRAADVLQLRDSLR
ncbi:MAG TPA: FG-GAP-like repeat-containing protein [Thermoanaerobaculia bacterium]|jgi:hypothetical protein